MKIIFNDLISVELVTVNFGLSKQNHLKNIFSTKTAKFSNKIFLSAEEFSEG